MVAFLVLFLLSLCCLSPLCFWLGVRHRDRASRVSHAAADAETAIFDTLQPSMSAIDRASVRRCSTIGVSLSEARGAPGAPYNTELNDAAAASARQSVAMAAAAELSHRLASCTELEDQEPQQQAGEEDAPAAGAQPPNE